MWRGSNPILEACSSSEARVLGRHPRGWAGLFGILEVGVARSGFFPKSFCRHMQKIGCCHGLKEKGNDSASLVEKAATDGKRSLSVTLSGSWSYFSLLSTSGLRP